jgi:hypothetical protein
MNLKSIAIASAVGSLLAIGATTASAADAPRTSARHRGSGRSRQRGALGSARPR